MTARTILVILDGDDCQHPSIMRDVKVPIAGAKAPTFLAVTVNPDEKAAHLVCLNSETETAVAQIIAEQANEDSKACFVVTAYDLWNTIYDAPCEVVSVARLDLSGHQADFDRAWLELEELNRPKIAA